MREINTSKPTNNNSMAYQAKPGTGSLFKNESKESSNHPDYKGSYLDHDGQEFWLSAWVKKGSKGTFLSIASTAKKDKAHVSDGPKDDSNDLPF